VTLLPALFAEDDVSAFVALHSRRIAGARLREGGARLHVTVLGVPRPVLYDGWHAGVVPGPQTLSRRLRHAEVVHAPSPAVPPVLARTALVVTVHDVAHLLYPDKTTRRGRWFHNAGLRAAARRAELVICPSEAAAADVATRSEIDPGRIRVVPMGVDTVEVDASDISETRRRLALGDRPYVLWVGTLEPRKNLGLLLEAFGVLASETDLPHRLVVAGPAGWLDAAGEVAAAGRALGDRLVVTGHVAEADLAPLYAGADVFAFCSHYEGFGLPVLEAMAQGTPVVCAATSALPEVAGNAARLVAEQTHPAWAAALADVLGDPAEASRLSESGRLRAAQFPWERTVRETHAVYEEALAAVRRRS